MDSEDKKLQEIIKLSEQREKAMQGILKMNKKFKNREKKWAEERSKQNEDY